MEMRWSDFEKSRYEQLLDGQMRAASHIVCLLALVLFPLFGFLDYYTQREKLFELWTYRGGATLFYLGVFVYLRICKQAFNPVLFSFWIVAFAAANITLQCMSLGGFISPYYSGIALVMLAAVVILPFAFWRMALVLGTILFIYIFGCWLVSVPSQENTEAIINNMFSLVATGVIGLAASYYTENMRRHSFDQYLQIEKAQADLRNSKEMLQTELKTEQGNVEMLVKEITQRKAELEKALGMRNEFISLASHELNTPLTSLKLLTQMTKMRSLHGQSIDEEGVRRLLETYDEQIKRLSRMVTDMLDISRLETGKLQLEQREVDLESLVRQVVVQTQQVEGKIITFSSQGPLVGQWDALRLEQVAHNLISNALKYGLGKPVQVVLERQGNQAILMVKDQGIGIPTEHQERIFDRFERAVTPSEFSGLGLGLFIVKQIVEGHGGEISVESTPQQGTSFIVSLPLSDQSFDRV